MAQAIHGAPRGQLSSLVPRLSYGPGINVVFYTADGPGRILAHSRSSTGLADQPPPSRSMDSYGSVGSVAYYSADVAAVSALILGRGFLCPAAFAITTGGFSFLKTPGCLQAEVIFVRPPYISRTILTVSTHDHL